MIAFLGLKDYFGNTTTKSIYVYYVEKLLPKAII